MELLAIIGIFFLLSWFSKALTRVGDFFIALGDSIEERNYHKAAMDIVNNRSKSKQGQPEDDPYLDNARDEIEELTK